MKFTGRFKNENGEIVNWWFEAPNEQALREHLNSKGWSILELRRNWQEEPIAITFFILFLLFALIFPFVMCFGLLK